MKTQMCMGNITALWRNRAMTTVHPMPAMDALDAFIRSGEVPQFPAIPENMEEVDKAGFAFTWGLSEPQGWCWQHPTLRSEKRFHTLNAAVEDAYWHHLGLAAEITNLKDKGYELVEGEAHFWRYAKAHRTSPLFPTKEAAWRDAIRVDAKVRARTLEVDARRGMSGPKARTDAADAIPLDLPNAVTSATDGPGASLNIATGEPYPAVGLTPGTPAVETSMAFRKRIRAMQNQLCSRKGQTQAVLDNAVGLTPDTPAVETSMAFRKRILESIGYSFGHESLGCKGWMAKNGTSCASPDWDLEAMVADAWGHYMQAFCTPEKVDAPNIAPGEPYPAVGTLTVVTPHNTHWGFAVVSDYLCTVLAYDGDYVWLRVAQYDGPMSSSRVSTRLDKIDIRPSEEQP